MSAPESAPPATAQDLSAPDVSPPGHRPQRRLLTLASAGSILLLLVGTAAFLWYDRERMLSEAGLLATHRSERLAEELQQSLQLAQTVIHSVNEQLGSASSQPLEAPSARSASAEADWLAALPLPFRLSAIDAQGRKTPLPSAPAQLSVHPAQQRTALNNRPPGRWDIGDVQGSPGQQTIPLRWRTVSNSQGIASFGMDLDFAAVQRWLERERRNPDDVASLLRLNPDGTASLLARSPPVDSQLGDLVAAHWLTSAQHRASGTVDLTSPADGQHRRAAFLRLAGPGDPLVVLYGLSTHSALAGWHAQLPYWVGLALLLAAGIGAGGWWLDRTLRELTDIKRKYQLALQSGNVWVWDIAAGNMGYAPSFLQNLGYPPAAPNRQVATLYQYMRPEDAIRVRAALRDHVLHHKPYATTFRMQDSEGRVRWFETQGQAFWNKNGIATYMAGTIFEITLRQQLQEAQRQTLQRLETVANASPVLFWTADLHGKRDWVNQRWLAFTGRTLAQELDEGWMAGIHPDDRERRRAAALPKQEEAASWAQEYRLLHQDGSYRWVVEQCLPRMDADHQPIGHIGSCVDITELREAEAAAQQRSALLERVFDVLQDMLFVVDRQGRFLHYQGNRNAPLYAASDLFLGRTINDVMPEAHARLLYQALERAQTGQLCDFDYSLALPGGDRQFNARAARLPDSDQYMFVARDITERETLKQQSERLRKFLMLQLRLASGFINQPLDAIDGEIDRALGEIGAFVDADRAYIFSYDIASNTARNTHEWCQDGIEPAIDQLQELNMDLIPQWLSAHLQQKAFQVEDVQKLPDGNLRNLLEPQGVRSLITLPMNATMGLLGSVGFDSVRSAHAYDREEIRVLQVFAQMLVNVRERQRAEAQLRELTGQLEQRVAERTSQLGTTVKRLSQANRELESFAYSVSHDLKSPLRSMEGFASLLLEKHTETINAEARNYLERIQNATRHMARLINDLLAYARIEQFEQGLVPLALASVVDAVLESMRNELDAQAAQVTTNITDTLQAIAHPQGLSMVLRNLLDNALKFSHPGQPAVISIQAAFDGPVVHLSVTDRGQGFDMQYHDRIFAIFQRLHPQDRTPGTGIGLAMVYKAVERMEGRIWAQSAPGEGTTFHIELPRA